MSNGRALRARVELLTAPLDAALGRLWERDDQRRIVPLFLLHTHQILRASVSLMECAREVAVALSDRDDVAKGLVDYFARHIEEERFHDQWALDDLAAAGISRVDALAQMPSPHTAAAVGAQYYWIRHHHPVSLLGYIAVLEDSPPSPAFIEDLERRSGLPDEAFRTLRKHGCLDPGHRDDLDRFVDGLPLARAHRTAIGISIAHTAASIAQCLDDLIETAGRA